MNIRDSNGRLDMSAVRKDNDVLSQRQEYPSVVERSSMEYTAEWVNNVCLPQRAQSSCPLRSMETYQQRKVALSCPAMSVRSKTSKTAWARSLIEMELKQMKERQKLNKESRELEQGMKRDELERQRKWAELRERRQLQEMEARQAWLEEDMGIDSDDSDLGFDQGEQVQE